jgi:hypothetical protein
MRFFSNIAFVATIVLLLLKSLGAAQAQCAPLPYSLSNGQPADATQVMANFNTLHNCITSQSSLPIVGPGGGTISLQNPTATSNYNFNFPATAGSVGALLTSGGGGPNTSTWTSVGSSGHSLPYLDGANAWTGIQKFATVLGAVATQSGSSYTLASSDCGATVLFTNSAPVTVTTTNSLPVGCAIALEQGGLGQITVVSGAGAAQHSAHG